MSDLRDGPTFSLKRGNRQNLTCFLVALFMLATPQFTFGADDFPLYETEVETVTVDETLTNNGVTFGDTSLTYHEPFIDQKYEIYDDTVPQKPATPPPLQEESPQEITEVQQIIFVEQAHPKVQVLKGHAWFLLGITLLAMCFATPYRDPATKGLTFKQGIESNVKSLFQFDDVSRSLFVSVAALLSFFLILTGVISLTKTLPSHSRSEDFDEALIARIFLDIFFIWLEFMVKSRM